MKEILDRQVKGYANWKATITPQVGSGGAGTTGRAVLYRWLAGWLCSKPWWN